MTRPIRRPQRGQTSRFTADEITEIQSAYAAVRETIHAARALRAETLKRFGLRSDEFHRYGTGCIGKKPREAA